MRRQRCWKALSTTKAAVAVALLPGLILTPHELHAQEDVTPETTLRAGDLVRIRPLGVTRHDLRSYRKGTITELADGWLTVSREKSGDPYRIATDSIRTLAVADGMQGHPGTGIIIGFFGGCGLGMAIAELTQPTPRDPYRSLSGCGIGLLVGSVGGGYVGATVKSTHWREVPLEGLRLGIGLPAEISNSACGSPWSLSRKELTRSTPACPR